MKFVIAIDGPAAAGKGTIALKLAKKFGFEYLDTGLLYRAVASKSLNEGIKPEVAALNLTQSDLSRTNLRDPIISKEAAKIKNINNEVAGKADVLLVPNLETGNSLSKIMVYFMNACAAGFVVGGKVPVVVTSRADNAESRLASIAAAIIAA